MYIKRPCKVLHSSKQTVFHSRGEELMPDSREGDSRHKIHLVYVDIGQLVAGLAVGNEFSVSLSCLV